MSDSLFPGLTDKFPFLVQALLLSPQVKHLLMHFCKLPHLTRGPADQWKGTIILWMGVRSEEHQCPGKGELKALQEVRVSASLGGELAGPAFLLGG